MNTTGRRPGSSEAQWAFASDAGFKSASASPSASAFGGGPDGPRVGASWGPFWIEAELGRGASARVYRARVAESGDLALKVLLNPSEPARQRLAREAWLVGQLQHPGIVALRGAGEVGRTPFVLYDLVSGARPLSSAWLNLSTEKRVDLVTQVATAVGYAHSCGVTHRDLKPANVLVDEDGDPRVVDFGLATHAEVDALTRSGAWVGTPSYMAPEQFEATRAGQTPAVDVWSLGVLLYEALTERLPFHGASVVQLATRVMDTAPTPPRRLNAEVTPQVEAVCLRALAKDPAARFPDARAFALALRAALGAPPPPRRGRWALLAALALPLALLTVWALAPREPEAPKPAAVRPPAVSPFAELTPMEALDAWGPEPTRERARAWLAEHPDDLDARITLAGSLARLKDWGSAYAEARAVLRARPDDLLALEILAVSAYGKQDVAAAREYCERGLALDSSRPRLWQIKSVIEAFHGDNEGALLASRRALELEPNDPEALANYGLAISMQGDDEGALRYYDQALAIEDSADTRFNRAVSYMRLERFRECLADAEVVRRELPGESSGYCLRASALANLDPPAALEAVAQLEADFPADARAAHTRGEVYRRLGTPDQAREAYRLCIELDPEGVYARLARKALRKLESRR